MDRLSARVRRLQPQARTSTGAPAPRRLRRLLAIAALTTAALAAGTASASASIAMCDVPITMSDGVVLRANIYLPATTGHYPTVLTVTGYNKNAGAPTGECAGSTTQGPIAGGEPALAEKGFAVMVLDDRGTGDSGGKWDSWGERTQQDYKEVLDWIQEQSWSDGGVATTGPSYMGITSLLIAEADAARVKEGKPRAVKAVWADIPMADAYRDVTFQGGSVDSGFIPLWLGLVTALSDLPPASAEEDPQEAATNYVEHLFGNAEFSVSHILGASLGEEDAYDGPFYKLRSPVVRASEITVPVVITGGWWDLFQRGEPLLWESLKNSKDRVLFMSAHYHITSGPEYEDPNLKEEWFSHWLKGTKNNVQKTPKVNLYPINGSRWEHFKSFPLPKSKYQRLYLNGESSGSAPVSVHDGSLASAPPKAESGRHRAAATGLEPVLAGERAVDGGDRVEPDLRHDQQHLRGELADLLDRAAGGPREDRGSPQDEPVGESQHLRRDARRGAERGRTGRQIRTDHGRLPAGEPAGDRPEPRDLRAEEDRDAPLAPVHERKPASGHAGPADRIRSRDLPDGRDRARGRQAATDDRHGQHVHRHADSADARAGARRDDHSAPWRRARLLRAAACRSVGERGTARG